MTWQPTGFPRYGPSALRCTSASRAHSGCVGISQLPLRPTARISPRNGYLVKFDGRLNNLHVCAGRLLSAPFWSDVVVKRDRDLQTAAY